MGLYDKYILPKITHCVCATKAVQEQRERMVPQASGQVLEIGAGSGLNLPHYNTDKVDRLYALEPAEEFWAMATDKLRKVPFEVIHLKNGAEEIPLTNDAVDTILVTYALCTIPDLDSALAEFRRVLKPGGQFLFSEHGLAPDAGVRKWQNRITPFWKKIGGGCHLNRNIPELLEQAGFSIGDMKTEYLPGWKPATYNLSGSARCPDC